jgi:hypothetical protein
MLNEEDVQELARGRYAFINVWRSISDAPVERMPLAVCEEVGCGVRGGLGRGTRGGKRREGRGGDEGGNRGAHV